MIKMLTLSRRSRPALFDSLSLSVVGIGASEFIEPLLEQPGRQDLGLPSKQPGPHKGTL
jgi:hypothetical protein